MNSQVELIKKEKELKIIRNLIEETVIISQQKYLTYLEDKEKLENEIKQLKQEITTPRIIKTWIEIEGGWRKRVYKNE